MRWTSMMAAMALLLAAWAVHSSIPLGWGAADAPDGTRFKVSPVGLSHVLQPHQTVSADVKCGWSPPSGVAELCRVAPGGAAAHGRLRTVRPVLLGTVALAVTAALLAVAGAPLGIRLAASAGAAAGPVLALLLFATSVDRAILVLSTIPFGLAAALGTMLVGVAVVLALASLALQLRATEHRRASLAWAAAAALAALAWYANFAAGMAGGTVAALVLLALPCAIAAWLTMPALRPR